MRIAVLADTHVHRLEQLSRTVIDALYTVDLIIHAGDFTEMQLLIELRQLKEVKGVHGNMDSTELKTVLPFKEIAQVENKRIGIIHGSGAPWGTEDRVRQAFRSDRVDVIVYGHSHLSQSKVIDNILFFNPGKASDSFGIITIEGELRGQIISSRQ
ncbi:MAG: metallophosphoesterase family protein [Dehalococcoidia bacterium]